MGILFYLPDCHRYIYSNVPIPLFNPALFMVSSLGRTNDAV